MNRLIIKNFEDADRTQCKYAEHNMVAPRWNPECFRIGILGGSGSGKTNLVCNFIVGCWKFDRGVIITAKISNEDKFKKIVRIVGNDKLRIIPTEENEDSEDGEPNGIENAVKKAKEFIGECQQGFILFDDLSWEQMNNPIVSDVFRKGRKDNISTGFSTQSYDSAGGKVGNEKKKIVNNLTDLIILNTPSNRQITSILTDLGCGIAVADFSKLVKLMTHQPYDFLHYDMRAAKTGFQDVNDTSKELELTGIPFNSSVIRWNSDNSKWNKEICDELKRQVTGKLEDA